VTVTATATSAAIESSFAMDLEPTLKVGGDGEKKFWSDSELNKLVRHNIYYICV
jgi:hypothetical protein